MTKSDIKSVEKALSEDKDKEKTNKNEATKLIGKMVFWCHS